MKSLRCEVAQLKLVGPMGFVIAYAGQLVDAAFNFDAVWSNLSEIQISSCVELSPSMRLGFIIHRKMKQESKQWVASGESAPPIIQKSYLILMEFIEKGETIT